jgi:peptidoglycan/xylan/chitin deacetylase (PgdA/CDA1 family)
MAVTLSQFEHQMCYLHDRGYHCLPLREVLQISANNLLQKKTFALTFDDGYEDFYTLAYPVLRNYSFIATVFMVTDQVGEKNDSAETTHRSSLNWKQIDELHRAGISFGSHTHTHRQLTRLSNDEIWHELLVSKQRLEARLNYQVLFLAYPYGDSNSEIQKMAEAAGYLAGCGVLKGRGGRFNLRRREIHSVDNILTFRLKLTRWHRLPIWLRTKTAIGKLLDKLK